jgi:hypothetical protein
MFGSVILDVAIGLILIYLLLSLISAAVREAFAGLLKTRSSTLHEGLGELLGDAELVAAIYGHPLINALYHGDTYAVAKAKKQLPSYIPARSFSLALFDLIVRGDDIGDPSRAGPESRALTIENVRAQIGTLGNPRVQRAVLAALDSAQGDLGAAQANVEQWFNSTMDRVSGWYKQRSQIWVFVIGLLLALAVDADTMRIARQLYTDPAQRQTAVAMAGSFTTDAQMATTPADSTRASANRITARDAFARLDTLGLPLGWKDTRISAARGVGPTTSAIAAHSVGALFGWILTALAITLGAPFWFDTLGRVMIIRSTVKPHQKSPEEGSEDRQTSPAAAAVVAPVSAPARTVAPAAAAIAAAAPVISPDAADFTPQEWAAGHPDGGIL